MALCQSKATLPLCDFPKLHFLLTLFVYILQPTVDSSSTTTNDENVKKPTLMDLFRPNIILKRTLNMGFQWFSVTMCYYGLSFAATDLLGDPYTNALLSYAIEIPGYVFCIIVMDRWGRRPILSFCQILSGISCIGKFFFPFPKILGILIMI